MTAALRVGVVGAGSTARERVDSWGQAGAGRVVLLRPDPGERSRRGVEDRGEVDADVLAFVDQVDLVDVCAPSTLSASVVIAAAAAGRPTLCGWGFVESLGEAQSVAAMFDDRRAPMIIAGLRCVPAFAAAQAAVAQGSIGRPAVLRLSLRSPPPPSPGPNPLTSIFADVMLPALDYLRWIAGPVETVYATATSQGPGFAIAILQHRDGAISHLQASWANPACEPRATLEISGADGLITFRSDHAQPVNSCLSLTAEPARTAVESMLEGQLRLVIGMLDAKGGPVNTAGDWVEALRLVLAAERSADHHAPVRVDPEPGEGS
jgi:predicted dehydrogenase